jgi:uncharacterized phiE125 gp8 family phage protein
MGLSLVTPASVAPLLLDQAKAHLRIDSTDDDALLTTLIDAAAGQYFGEHGTTGRSLLNETYDATWDAWPVDHCLRLPRSKVQSVTSVKYIDTAGDEQTLAADQYTLISDVAPGRVDRAYGVSWPTLRTEANAVRVRFVAGFGSSWNDIPRDLQVGLLHLVAHWHETREPIITGTTVAKVPFSLEAIFAKYKVH